MVKSMPRLKKFGSVIMIVICVLFSNVYWASGQQIVAPFDDISNAYAQNQILDLYNKNIINGTGNRKFEPDKTITRAEFITILDRTLNLEPVNNDIPSYSDISKNQWFYGWVEAGTNVGIIEGRDSNKFDPYKSITREEAAALLVRALKQQTVNVSSGSLPFHDATRTSSWAASYVMTAYKLGLIVGDTSQNFRPTDPITRQETAIVIDRIVQNSSWYRQLQTSPSSQIVLGWQYDESTFEFENRVLNSEVNVLSPRWYFVEDQGKISNITEASLATWAKNHNKKIWPLVGNHSDMEVTHQALTEMGQRNHLIKQLADFVQAYQLDGLTLDFENVSPGDRQAFSSFVSDLAAKLHDMGAILTVCVSPDSGTDWTAAFDYAALGKSADYIVLMGYDEHWDDENPGSVSSLPWLEDGVTGLLSAVPANKIVLALPFYTKEWISGSNTKTSNDLTLGDQDKIINGLEKGPVWDASIGQYIANYQDNKGNHSIWVEDSRSLSLKFELAATKHIAGIGFWYVGGETPDIWASLRNVRKYTAYTFSTPTNM